jgi:TrpR-related protein YerC/YecD
MENNNTPITPFDELFDAFLLLKTKEEVERFMKDLCTPQELNALAERWRVCKLLETGDFSYREIHAQTGASLATITRVARFLKNEPHQGYSTVLRKIKNL